MPAVLRGIFRQPEASVRRRTEEIYDASMVSGTLPALNRQVGPIDCAGYQVASIQLTGTFTATVVVEQSNDGVNWVTSLINNVFSGTSSAAVTAAGLYFVQIAARYLRIRCSAYTSGTVVVTTSLKVGVAEGQIVQISGTPAVTMSSTLTTNCIFYDETNTALGGAAVLTGATRDVGVAAAGSHRHRDFAAGVFADQAGTLRIENSRDGSTWRRASADQAVAANEHKYIYVPVMARYHRMVYTNGATPQTIFQPQTAYLGN